MSTTMRVEITDLPEEVLRIIFKKLDGMSLFRVARVCKFWHRIVHELRRHVKMWSKFCLTEIPIPLLVEMTGVVDVDQLLHVSTSKKDYPKTKTSTSNDFPDNGRKNNNVVSTRLPWQFWREVYLAYRRSILISRWPCLRLVIKQNKDYGKTTCVKFHGNLLLTGHENGSVLCWQNAGTKSQIYTVLHRHLSMVTALAVVDNSNLKNGKSSAFTVISGSDDRHLRFTIYESKPLQSAFYNHSSAITCISSWSQYFVFGCHATGLHSQWVFHLTSNLKWKRCYNLLGHKCSYIRSTAIWKNKVVTGDNDGNIYIWKLIPTDTHALQPLVIHNLPGPIQQTLICGDRIVCLANKNVLAVSLNGEVFFEFSIHNDIYRTPECLRAWGPILAIGLKSGIINVYHLDTDAEWKNINVSQPLKMLHTGQEHILDLSIVDSGVGLSIAFSTDDGSIHLAHWLPHLPQNTT